MKTYRVLAFLACVLTSSLATLPDIKCSRPNEIWSNCPRICPPQTCKALNKIYHCPAIPRKCDKNTKGQCICRPGYYRNIIGQCISKNDCLRCTGEHEYFSCGGACDNICKSLPYYNQTNCPIINVKCNEMCYCEKGYARNTDNVCVPFSQCEPPCGPNEDAVQCPKYSNAVSCDQEARCIHVPPYPSRPGKCYTNECICKEEYYRDYCGDCVHYRVGEPAESPAISRPEPGTTNPEDDQNALMLANDKFTASFFYAVTQEYPGQNIISSPFSVLFPLALLCLYTRGESRVELENALNLYDDDQIKSAIRALIDHIESQEQVDLTLAFKVFVNELYQLSDEFLDTAITYFDSEAENVDFGNNVEAAKIINDWVAEKTNNKIKDILSPDLLSEATRLVIANCIYFLGNWTKQFDEKLTTTRNFYLDENTFVLKETMYKLDNVKYVFDEALESQMVELPYKGGNMSLLIILPSQIDGLPDLIEKLRDHTLVKEAYNNMSSQKVQLHVPKVEYETKIDLKKILQRIGINKIFTNDSGITGILKDNKPLVVSDAIQKAFVKINERGTEAAAANVIVVGTTSAQIPIPVFDANHPFYFEILLGNNPLFAGTVVS